MKSKILLAFSALLLQSFAASAQQLVMAWHNSFGGSASDQQFGASNFLCPAQNDGFVWLGRSYSNDGDVPENNGDSDEFILKHNSVGDIGWSKIYGGSSIDWGVAIRHTADNGFIVVGTACSNDGDVPANSDVCTVWVKDLGTGGNIVWQNIYGLPNTDNNHAHCIAIVQGGYVISGISETTNEDWLMKISETGQEIWTTILPQNFQDRSASIEATSDGGIIGIGIAGLIKLNADGDVEWTTSSGTAWYAQNSVTESPDQGFVYTRGNRIEKVNDQGQLLWVSGVPVIESNCNLYTQFTIARIIQSEQGGFLACGYWFDFSVSGYDSYESALVHFHENGDYDWQLTTYFSNTRLSSLIELDNGNVIAGGTILNYTEDFTSVSYDGIVMRFALPTIQTDPLAEADTEICAGETIAISANAENGWFPNYEIQLSDANGSFANPIVLLTTYFSNNECTIPNEIPAGDGYRIRYVSLQNGQIGDDNGQNITITPFINPMFSENVGSVVGADITIAVHEAANGFHQDGYTMSGTGLVSNTNPSTGYLNATGAANIFLGSSATSTFIISGINTIQNDLQYLEFGLYSPGFLTPAVVVAVSTDGINYTNLSFSPPFSPGWGLVTTTGEIPQTANLRIRFTRLSAGGNNARIDDIRLIQDPANAQIDASGPTAFCGPGNVILVAPSATSWLWNTGAVSQTLNVSTTGDYTCLVGSANGCDITLGPVHVQTTATNYYTDADEDGYGDPSSESLLCAPDATHAITTGGDCDDQNASVHEGALEKCDGVDNNCNGDIDEYSDDDLDGYTTCQGDCNDSNPSINPGMMETNYNNNDDNCNGITDESNTILVTFYLDSDGDLYGDPTHPYVDTTMPEGCVANFLDCDDTDPEVYASAEEVCGDGKDNNCDGIVDNCAPSTCVGDLDNSGNVNITDLLIFLGVFGTSCD